jgi:hypothetical protein
LVVDTVEITSEQNFEHCLHTPDLSITLSEKNLIVGFRFPFVAQQQEGLSENHANNCAAIFV